MPPRRKLSDTNRGRALAWIQDGIAIREVARRLGVSHSVIQRLRDRVHATGRVAERHRTGRPSTTTRRQDRFIVTQALRDRTVTASGLRDELRAASNTNVSDQTIRNRLRAANLASRVAAVRTTLLPRHRVARAAWCTQHVRWTVRQWSDVLFTDESRFTLRFNDGRVRVWRRVGERFTDATVRQHDRYGGGSVMMWGGISFNHRTPLHHVPGNLTGLRYRDEILNPVALPTLQAIGNGAVLQDDNARPHRAAVVTNFLQQQGVVRMPWPACSPDLSPIEHLWDVLGRAVRRNHPPAANQHQLVQFLQQEWAAIPQVTLRNLIRSMRRRCTACLAARGGHTRY